MPKAVKEKRRLHAPAADFSIDVKQEPQSEYDIHLKNLETIQSQLPPVEHQQEIEEEQTTKQPEPKLTKEEKRKQRHDRLLKKLNHASVEIQKQKEEKQPKKTVKREEEETPLGLMTKDLLTTLLEAEAEEERARERRRGDVKVRAQHFTDKERQDLLKKEVQQFRSVIEHPVFQANPLATIKEHLTNSIALQKAKDSKTNTNNNINNQDKNNKKNKNNKKKPLTQQLNEKRRSGKEKERSEGSSTFGGGKMRKNMQGIQKIKKPKKK